MKISLSTSDHLLLMAMGFVIGWVTWDWIQIANSPNAWNIFGAWFMIIFATMMIKFIVASTSIGLDWLLPRIIKGYKKRKAKKSIFSNIFGYEIKLIIQKRDKAKVTF